MYEQCNIYNTFNTLLYNYNYVKFILIYALCAYIKILHMFHKCTTFLYTILFTSVGHVIQFVKFSS